LGISDDLQVFLRPEADITKYGTATDNQLATSLLFDLRKKLYESDNDIRKILVQFLSDITEVGWVTDGISFLLPNPLISFVCLSL
jgi:hypothetical protein